MIRRALSALIVVLPLAAALSSDVRADDPPAAPTKPSSITADEQEALTLFRTQKYLTARTRAQAILDARPQSIVGHFVLGSVLREAEGSLPRSMAHLREARRLADLVPKPHDKEQVWLFSDILKSLEDTAYLMEHYDEELAILDTYDQEYVPKLPAWHVWPLLKLHRYDEGRAFAREALASGGPFQELTALNGLCAIEGMENNRQAGYDACKRTYDTARAHGSSMAVYAHNACEAAESLLRFEEAEQLALGGTHRLERSNSNPWRELALLYASEGRADDAVAALREAQRWVTAQPPRNRDQKSAEHDAVVAAILLAGGEPALGLRFIGRALDRPDRRAVISSDPDQSLGGHALLRRALYRLDAEVKAEQASARGLAARASGMAASLAARAAAWPDEERAVTVLANETRLVLTLRPYANGALEAVAEWLKGDLVGLLGAGVVSAALGRARAADAGFPEMTAYFDAMSAEIALARGEDAAALGIAERTLEALPRAEALLRARVAAVGAEAARRAGQVGTSVALFERAMALDPGVVRRLGLAIPARVDVAGGGALGARAGAALARSPRIRRAASGFVVRVEGNAQRMSACLVTPSGASLSCGFVTAEEGEGEAAVAERLADEFHRAAFAMKFSLTPTDLRSLDGSTTAAQGSARDALKGVLGDEAGDGEKREGEKPKP